MSEGILMKREC